MIKIILIDPPGFGEGISTGLAYLAAVAKQNGFSDIAVVDFQNYRQNVEERINKIIAEQPDIIGFTINSFTVINAIKIIKQLKGKVSAKFIAGGPGVTSDPKIFLERTGDLFDVAVFSEGERTFVELLKYFSNNNSVNLSAIKGIAYQSGNGEITVNEGRELINNLDEVPFPDYDVFDSVKFNKKILSDSYQILTSRGCPARCVFCLNLVLNRGRWRGRSTDNVIKELVMAKEKYGIKSFTVRDDNFTQHMDRAEEICERLIALNFNTPWKCKAAVRADRVRPSLLNKMKKSGCDNLTLGIESGDPAIYPLVCKGESLETIATGIKMIKEAGIHVEVTMVIGVIEDSYKSVLQSIKFLKKIGVKAHWYLALPFRGTPLFDWVKKNGTFLVDCDFIDAYAHSKSKELVVPFETKEFTADERRKAYYKANISSENFNFIWIDGFVQSNRYKHLSRLGRAWVLLTKTLRYHPQYFFKAVKYLLKIYWRRRAKKI